MIVRNAKPEDAQEIERIHGQMGMDYKLPDLENPLFLVRKVAEDENGHVTAVCYLRLEAETYLWLDPLLDPRKKMETMLTLQPEVLRAGWEQGLNNIVAWIPEAMERKFQRRLHELGWHKDRVGWHSWSRPLGETAP